MCVSCVFVMCIGDEYRMCVVGRQCACWMNIGRARSVCCVYVVRSVVRSVVSKCGVVWVKLSGLQFNPHPQLTQKWNLQQQMTLTHPWSMKMILFCNLQTMSSSPPHQSTIPPSTLPITPLPPPPPPPPRPSRNAAVVSNPSSPFLFNHLHV